MLLVDIEQTCNFLWGNNVFLNQSNEELYTVKIVQQTAHLFIYSWQQKKYCLLKCFFKSQKYVSAICLNVKQVLRNSG